ncbi:hypothetical protein OPT61_g4582 [Boeremia exigua]|uniref:Uncharacterized protein n=1 Tax=Boeremia exigua TaxID=749465 RepID=A0ACC2IDL5_9PLEO|nr:hypothetical protein OPT61_g4582 [Boeremia exigua]
MNLYWPSESLFESKTGSAGIQPEYQQSKDSDDDGCSNNQKTMNAHIYPQSLDHTQIRLARLSSTTKEDCPVHVHLEVYDRAYRPEYEAASYMWGGEEGDSTLCEPVYIGPYWDVLLQTKNCHAMLDFVRPWRGIRMLWVDAVCINQQDLKEREVQVSGMRQTYQDCTRVVVYLGKDIALKRGTFPRYTSLDRMALQKPTITDVTAGQTREPNDLSSLLARRYFSRVWMVQELTLSSHAVIRVGNTDFHANSTIIARISSASDTDFLWDLTSAPWMQYLGGGMLFALLPLLPTQYDGDLPPDYTLSFQQLSIGLFGYILIALRDTSLLGKAGIANRLLESVTSDSVPSWVPVCKSHGAWRDVFKQEHMAEVYQWGAVQWGVSDFADLLIHPELDTSTLTSPYPKSFVSGQGKHVATHFARSARAQDSLSDSWIDSQSGALILTLTHLLTFDRVPSVTQMRERLYQYAIYPDNPEFQPRLRLTS